MSIIDSSVSEPTQSLITEPNYQHPYRHVNMVILFIASLFGSFITQSLSTINYEVTTYFPGVSTTQVSLCALVFMITHPFMAFPCNYILDTYSLKLGISIMCICTMTGALIRLLIFESFIWVIVGNFVFACGNVFVINVCPKFSAIWFAPEQRLLISSLLIFANSISGGFGSILSPFFVKDKLPEDQGRHQVIRYIFIQAIIIIVVMSLNLIFFRGTPNKQKCLQKLEGGERQPYKETMKELFTKKQYLILMATMMLTLSALNCFATNIELLIIPFGLTSKDSALSVGVSLLFGLIGSVLAGMIVKRNKQYKRMLQLIYVAVMVIVGSFTLALNFKLMPLFWISTGLLGLTVFPVLSILVEYSCQMLYPIGQASVGGFMFCAGQLTSFCIGLFYQFLLKDKTKEGAALSNLLIALSILCSLILVSFTTQNLRRMDAQTKEQGIEEPDINSSG